MSELQNLIEETYEKAKKGRWDQVLPEWKDIPLIAFRCSRYQKESSGWTFLHQAAYFGHEIACRELIRLGASVNRLSREGKTAADVAEEKGHTALADLLRRSFYDEESLWVSPSDPDLGPKRDAFKISTIDALRTRFASRCSNTDCRVPTTGPTNYDTKIIPGTLS
ncbi:MAG: hypothetical protein OMM_12600 [Candidatus Magnetoglobus multicellularis str. Araruama]|uniref:Uncharacterized protein n=1 Tax=Candidatus Magnetoglobus multicellularis str. Araruama TaxID=890399 RepID=A0A1V1NVK5_9BACT|nr:MAG: hypothetical protein OMM_12600 [Candidatus Magnetoglobus multicellularis str. Araruama]